jgi:hypothetical protein
MKVEQKQKLRNATFSDVSTSDIDPLRYLSAWFNLRLAYFGPKTAVDCRADPLQPRE